MKYRCIIVDDEELARNLIQKHLAQLDDFELVANCASAIEANAVLKNEKVDLLFFNKYPTMETINQEIINKVPEEDYFKWFPGASLNKIIIIMKLCNNPKYESYKSKNISIGLQFVKQNPQMWKTKYERYISLINFLDNGTYLKIIEKDNLA